jgi:hypothetical protein
MPKVELGTFGVVDGEELKIEEKTLPVGGAFCVLVVLWLVHQRVLLLMTKECCAVGCCVNRCWAEACPHSLHGSHRKCLTDPTASVRPREA